jgi:hypothetical protein
VTRQPPALVSDDGNIDPIQARVDAAAFTLLREGRNPTVALVRDRMGGASPNAVAPALQRWRQTFAAQLDANAGSALEILPPGVLEIVQALWSRALFEAHRVRADSPSAANALEALNAAVADLRDQAARLEVREAQVDARLRELDDKRLELREMESALLRRRSPAHQPRSRPAPRQTPKAQRPPPAKRPATKRAKPASPTPKRRPKPARRNAPRGRR